MLPELALHPLQHLLPERLTAQTPTPTHRLTFGLIHFLLPPCLHPPLELHASGRRIRRNPMFPQQPVHPHPPRPMLRCGQEPPQAAPRIAQQPILRPQQSCPRRVQVHIITERLQIPVATALHQQHLITSAEHVPEELVPVVEADRVGAQQPAHARHQVGLRRLDHQMKVIPHQAIGMDLKPRLLTGLGQGLQKILPIHVVLENVFTPVPPAHDVVSRPGKLHSQLARLGRTSQVPTIRSKLIPVRGGEFFSRGLGLAVPSKCPLLL